MGNPVSVGVLEGELITGDEGSVLPVAHFKRGGAVRGQGGRLCTGGDLIEHFVVVAPDADDYHNALQRFLSLVPELARQGKPCCRTIRLDRGDSKRCLTPAVGRDEVVHKWQWRQRQAGHREAGSPQGQQESPIGQADLAGCAQLSGRRQAFSAVTAGRGCLTRFQLADLP